MRRPLGPEPMNETVRFRLTASDMEHLHAIRGDASASECIRRLIEAEYRRQTS